MRLLKELQNMKPWVKCALVISTLVLLWAVMRPKEVHFAGLGNMMGLEHMENKGEESFVMFYAPWCGYCKRAMPEWDSLENSYKKCKIMKVNCDDNKELAKMHNVKSFPTIKYLPKGVNSPEGAKEYEGNRTMSDFTKFLDQVVQGDPSDLPNQAKALSADVPQYRAGQGPLTTSFVGRNVL